MIYKSQIKYTAICSLCAMGINAFQFYIAKNRAANRKITEMKNENKLLNEKIIDLEKEMSNWRQ